MSFLGLVVKNPFRSKTRTTLAIIGIAIGIATIVALGVITDGLKYSTEETLKSGGSDFLVVEANVSDMMFSSIDDKRVDDIINITGVQDAVGVLIGVYPIADNPYFVVMGMRSDKLSLGGVSMINGQGFSDNKNEIILGKAASQKLNKTVGDTLEISGKEFKITGIFETGDLQKDGGAFMPLDKLQDIDKKDDEVTMVFAKLDKDANLDEVTKKIDDTYTKELMTVKSLEDFGKVDSGLQMIDTASWAISLLAIVIGGIGVINTMIMTVFERTREIGVLKAVGWKNRRILGMILGESIVLTLLAGVVGIVMGLVAIQLLMMGGMGGFIQPVYTMDTFAKALGIALFVGLIGGFYPAYRASRLPPTEALRYE
ncbi:ABC transporter permease [Methanobacterium sp. ACI-7]|uniref:ABC transporter permease n=1 Tax=unclassified Methanobacterium TaxID=2627676 RepID=UPI0039C36B3A